MPALHERLDEIPWFLQRAFAAVDPQLTAAIATLEMCALRRWPGNVRELLLEAKHAGHAALAEGATAVRPDHFAPCAGLALSEASSSYPAAANSSKPPSESARSASAIDDASIAAALAEHDGNVSRAAQALGLHRNQLRRWIAKREGK
jgi:DNA-binding NtrC family response regulator